MATIHANPSFNAEVVAKELRKAMKGFGTDEKSIITALTDISNAQRLQVILAFKQMFGKDLIADLKSELGGKLEKVILALMTPTVLYDARELRAAMKGAGTDEGCLIEILASRTNEQIAQIKAAYKKDMSRDLESDMMSETSGHFKRMLISLCTGCRDEHSKPDHAMAQQNAKALHEAGVKKMGTDESVFNRILCTLSPEQLKLVFAEYHKLTGKPIEDAIKSEFSGSIKAGLMAIVQCMKNRHEYFASRLYYAMKGAGTDDNTLVRVIVSRSEIDLAHCKDAFQALYGKSLAQFVKDDTSGDYEKILLALVK